MHGGQIRMNIQSRLIGLIAIGALAGALFGHGFLGLSVAADPTPRPSVLLELSAAATLAIWLWYLLRHTQRTLPISPSPLLAIPAQQLVFGQDSGFQGLVDSLPEGVTYFDAEDRLIYCNRSGRELLSGGTDVLTPGVAYATILPSYRAGDNSSAGGQADGGIAERSRQRRQQVDAISEHRLADGRWLHVHESWVDVQSRHLMDWIEGESVRLVCPAFADELIRGEAFESL